jgi:hypothetical protein
LAGQNPYRRGSDDSPQTKKLNTATLVILIARAYQKSAIGTRLFRILCFRKHHVELEQMTSP